MSIKGGAGKGNERKEGMGKGTNGVVRREDRHGETTCSTQELNLNSYEEQL